MWLSIKQAVAAMLMLIYNKKKHRPEPWFMVRMSAAQPIRERLHERDSRRSCL